MPSEWESFKVGPPSSGNLDRQPFSTVYHVSHVEPAVNILKIGSIKAGLVFDKSKLNTTRTLVIWVSPNHWVNGYRYGNVRFAFDWKELIEDKKYYWIEVIDYKPKACRILISDQEHSQYATYDPKEGNGPWWYDEQNDCHYFNGTYCLEFMIESDISITERTELKFVDHHRGFCSLNRIYPRNCKNLGWGRATGGSIFLASVIAQSVAVKTQGLTVRDNFSLIMPSSDLYHAWSRIAVKLAPEIESQGSVSHESPMAPHLARAIFNAIAIDKPDEILTLRSLFASKEDCMLSCVKLAAAFFELEDWNDLYEGKTPD